VPRVEATSFWLEPLARFVSFRLNGKGQRGGRTRGSISDPGRGCMPEAASVSRDGIGEPSQTAEATKSPVGAVGQRGSAGCGYTDIDAVAAVPARRRSAPRTCLALECRQLRRRSMVRTANLNPQRHPEKTHHKLL
jgi:hypothetical protein